MKRMINTVFSAVWAAGMAAAAEIRDPEWLDWTDGRLLVGNEYGGFHDAGSVRYRRTDLKVNPYCGLPWMSDVPGEPGRLLLAVQAGRHPRCWYGTRKVLFESLDEGETWKIFNPSFRGVTNFRAFGGGKMIAHWDRCISFDDGKTWTEAKSADPGNPRRFGREFIGHWDPPIALRGTDGRHLIGSGNMSVWRTLASATLVPVLHESHDGGKTWSSWRGVPEFSGACEVYLAQNAEGELVAALREQSGFSERNDNVNRLSVSISSDGGKTWTVPKVVQGAGRHHPSIVLLPDGRLVLTYVVREGYRDEGDRFAYGVEAVVSYDGGRNWDVGNRYVIDRWTSEKVVRNADGTTKVQRRYAAAPQCTSTCYLPGRDELITAYGRNAKDVHVTLAKWKPLAKSVLDARPPAPVPLPPSPEAALSALRGQKNFPVRYDARHGLPVSGWLVNYEDACMSLKDGWLTIDNRDIVDGWCAAFCDDSFDRIYGPFGARMRLRLPVSDPGDETVQRFAFYAAYGTGEHRALCDIRIDRDAGVLSDTMGTFKLPVKAGEEFLLEIWADRRSRTAYVWVDGKLAATRPYDWAKAAPERYSECWFGLPCTHVRNGGGAFEISGLRAGGID